MSSLGAVAGHHEVEGGGPAVADPIGRGYRAHLDGLRAIAVYLVVVFHAGSDRFVGGFIGVDVFFVLSGYLVTQLLLRDLRGGGSIRYDRFYARRFRRLLPASFVALVGTAVVYSAVASPASAEAALDAFRAAFLYVANWFFIDQSADYFAADIESNPVIHFWSLAVEEQFYLLAPLVLGGLFAATRRLGTAAHRVRQLVVAGGAVASVGLALSLRGTNLNRAYYGTDTRAYQLLAGALLALTPGLIVRAGRPRTVRVAVRVATPVLLLALLGLATHVVDVDPVERGVLVTAVTVALLVALESATGGFVSRLLSVAPLVYLGKISYGTYLWHWPVLVVARELREMTPMSAFAIAALLATALASLSYHLLERPIRERPTPERANPAFVATGLVLSLIGALVIMPKVLDVPSGNIVAAAGDTSGFTPVPDLDFETVRRDTGGFRGRLVENCDGEPSSTCTVVEGSGEHVLVIGDSHAQMLFAAMATVARDLDLTLSTAASGGCPWQRRVNLGDDGGAADQVRIEDCKRVRRDLYERVIPELQPDVILAVSRDYLTRRPGAVYDERDEPIPAASPAELRSLIETDTKRSLATLREHADQVVIVEPIPVDTVQDPFDCLTKSEVVESCRFVANLEPLPVEQIYRDAADGEHVWSADFDRLACPFLPICDPIIDGRVTRFDNQHLAPAFSVSLADDIATYLLLAGIVDPAP